MSPPVPHMPQQRSSFINGLLEKANGILEAVYRHVIRRVAASDVQGVGFWILCSLLEQSLLLFAGQPEPELFRDCSRQFCLKRQDVGDFSAVFLSPDVAVVARPDQFLAQEEIVALLY